jgi:urease accessory protein
MYEPLIPLLHLCDSLFPLGSFAHSDGLEAAVQTGAISDADDLAPWLTACLEESIGRCDGPAIASAWSAFHEEQWDRLISLDADLIAMRPAAAGRAATGGMGRRLLKTWQATHGQPRLQQLVDLSDRGALVPSLPVAFAVVSASAGIAQRNAIEGYAYTRLAASVSAAMRLIAIGQIGAHTSLARILERVPAIVDDLLRRDAPPESFTPMLDIAAMTHRSLHSRLFRS